MPRDNASMRSPYVIRQAQPDDAPRLAVLATQVWMHTYATQGVSPVIADYVLAELAPQSFVAKLGNPAITILVAERDARKQELGALRNLREAVSGCPPIVFTHDVRRFLSQAVQAKP